MTIMEPARITSDAVLKAVADDCKETRKSHMRTIFGAMEEDLHAEPILCAAIAVALDLFLQKEFELSVPGFCYGGAIILSAPKTETRGRMRTREMCAISDAMEALCRSERNIVKLRNDMRSFGMNLVFVRARALGVIPHWKVAQFDQDTAGWETNEPELGNADELMTRCCEYSPEQRFALERTIALAARIEELSRA